MRRAATYLIAASLTVGSILPVAAQERPRSAPPSRGSSSGESKGGSATSGSNQNRGGERQADRREAGPSQSQAPRNDSRTFSGPSRPSGDSRTQARSNDSRGNDVRRNDTRESDRRVTESRNAPVRQAVPAPRDRFDNRYDRRDDDRGRTNYRYDNSYRYSSSRIIIAPRERVRFTRSWFNFRPWYRLDVGLLVGYALDFPSWYDPYIVGQPGYVRPYMPYGGVTFDIEPRDAELWVDGEYVGRASDYSPYDPPLTLVAGRHHIELTGRYYRSLDFEITVQPGQVIPYQGTLPYVR